MRHSLLVALQVLLLNEPFSSGELDKDRIHDINYFLSLPPSKISEYANEQGILSSLSSDIIFEILTYSELDEHTNSLLLEELDSRRLSSDQSTKSVLYNEYVDIPDFDFLKGPASMPQFDLEFKEGPEIAQILNDLSETQIIHYVDQYPSDKLIEIASKPGMIQALNPEKLKILSAKSDILNKMDSRVLIPVLEERPTILRYVSESALDTFGKRKSIIEGLTLKQLTTIIDDLEVRRKFLNISEEAILNIVNIQPQIVIHIIKANDSDPLKGRVNDFLEDEGFLRKIHPRVHLELADQIEFMKFISSNQMALVHVLRAFPELPSLLSPPTFEFYSRSLLISKDFVNSLPCSVFVAGAKNFTFIDSLPPRALSSLIRNSKMIDCLPEPILGGIIENTNIGHKIKTRDVYILMRKVSYSPRLRPKHIIWKILCFQVPKLKKYYLSYWW